MRFQGIKSFLLIVPLLCFFVILFLTALNAQLQIIFGFGEPSNIVNALIIVVEIFGLLFLGLIYQGVVKRLFRWFSSSGSMNHKTTVDPGKLDPKK